MEIQNSWNDYKTILVFDAIKPVNPTQECWKRTEFKGARKHKAAVLAPFCRSWKLLFILFIY